MCGLKLRAKIQDAWCGMRLCLTELAAPILDMVPNKRLT